MKKQYYLIVPLFIAFCVTWFAIARIRENQGPAPGWTRFGNNREGYKDFELWLPKYYEGVEPAVIQWMMTNAKDRFGSEFSEFFDAAEKQEIVFAARDTRTDDSPPDVIVSYSTSSRDSYTTKLKLEEIRSRVENIPYIQLIESKAISLGNYDAILLIYDANFEGFSLRQVEYIIYDSGTIWDIKYIPNKDKYKEELAIFEQSIQTFKAGP